MRVKIRDRIYTSDVRWSGELIALELTATELEFLRRMSADNSVFAAHPPGVHQSTVDAFCASLHDSRAQFQSGGRPTMSGLKLVGPPVVHDDDNEVEVQVDESTGISSETED